MTEICTQFFKCKHFFFFSSEFVSRRRWCVCNAICSRWFQLVECNTFDGWEKNRNYSYIQILSYCISHSTLTITYTTHTHIYTQIILQTFIKHFVYMFWCLNVRKPAIFIHLYHQCVRLNSMTVFISMYILPLSIDTLCVYVPVMYSVAVVSFASYIIKYSKAYSVYEPIHNYLNLL